MLFAPYVSFHSFCGRLLGNGCSLGLRYVLWYKYLIVSLFFPTSVFGVGISS